MPTGKVVRYDEYRGYGFVSPDSGGEDVFVHVNDLHFDKRLLTPGLRVEFAPEEGERGPKASQVRLLERSGPTETMLAAFAQPVAETPPPKAVDSDDGLCDVLSPHELVAELTEVLLSDVPSLTGHQIVAVRECLVGLARAHSWIED